MYYLKERIKFSVANRKLKSGYVVLVGYDTNKQTNKEKVKG